MKAVFQICPHATPPDARRRLKRMANRYLRRAGKRDPENAFTRKPIRWWDT